MKEHLLQTAVQFGHDECVKELIKGFCGLDLYSRYLSQAVISLASYGKRDVLHLLIKAGADVNSREQHGDTALIRAASAGNNNCVSLLIKAGADVNNRDQHGDTALIRAARSVHYLYVNPLSAAKRSGCECVKILVEAGADVNIKGQSGNSALTSVIKCPVCVEVLLEAGADVNSTSEYGLSLLLLSIKSRNIPCVKLLLKYGVDVNCIDRDGGTALTCAMERRYLYDHVAELIQAGADVNLTQRRNGFTPLMLAACSTNGERFARLLLRSGCKINIHNKYGQNALKYYASLRKSNMKLMALLFAAGETMGVKTPYSDVWKHREVDLKHLCRKTIRKHLLEIDPHTHLFDRVPQLGLPTSLCAYFLYNKTLADNDDHGDSDCSDYGITVIHDFHLM